VIWLENFNKHNKKVISIVVNIIYGFPIWILYCLDILVCCSSPVISGDDSVIVYSAVSRDWCVHMMTEAGGYRKVVFFSEYLR
jgi:hypothetical protein